MESPQHVLVFPFPLQGHMNCMLHLAEMLVYSGFHVTLLLSDYNLNRLRNIPSSLPGIPQLQLLSIPDGLPEDHARKVDSLLELMDSLETRARPLFKSLLLDLHKNSVDADGLPAVTCVIADGILPFMIDASEEVGVPTIAFRTASASSVWAYYCIPQLLSFGEIPKKRSVWDTNRVLWNSFFLQSGTFLSSLFDQIQTTLLSFEKKIGRDRTR